MAKRSRPYATSRSTVRVALPLLHYYEVWQTVTNDFRKRTGVLPYEELEDWLALRGKHTITPSEGELRADNVILRVLATDFHHHPFALGCGPAHFWKIRKAFNLHASSEEGILNNNGAFGRYLTREAGSSDFQTFSLVLKVANAIHIGYDAISLSFDLKTQHTRAFVHGLLDDEIADFILALESVKGMSAFRQPLFLPTQIYKSYRAKTEAYRVKVDDSLHQTEVQIGYAIPGMLQDTPQRYFRTITERTSRLDLETITRQLHSCSTELGTVINAATFGKEIGLFLCRTADELERKFPESGGTSISGVEELGQQIEFMTNMYTSLLSQVSILRERVHNHINLSFSLVAQEENRISRMVAEESSRLAEATKRDSAAMKSIALLTMIFLPPTFVATFFSMTMFDWTPSQDPQDRKRPTSNYLWVYWVVAVPLTGAVLLIWRLWMLHGNTVHRREQGYLKEEREKVPESSVSTQVAITPTEKLIADYSEAQRKQLRPGSAGRVP